MMQENVQQHTDRGPLFPGSSCFPLSPDQKHQSDYKYHTRGNKDQLEMIFSVIGTPSDEDVSAIGKDDARKYIRIFEKKEPCNLEKKFPGASSDAVDLLRRILKFNPTKRVSVEDALSHPYFSDLRAAENEHLAASKVRLPFDDWASMDAPQLRVAFLKEVQRYHPNVVIPEDLERETGRSR
eukprot:Trichotokara_eunicae@DN391_c0_g1_i1.p1